MRETKNRGLKRKRYERRNAKRLRERPTAKNVDRQLPAENRNEAVNGEEAHYGRCEDIENSYYQRDCSVFQK